MKRNWSWVFAGDDGGVNSWMCSSNIHRVRGTIWRKACGLAANMWSCHKILQKKFGFPFAFLFCLHCLFCSHYFISLHLPFFFSQQNFTKWSTPHHLAILIYFICTSHLNINGLYASSTTFYKWPILHKLPYYRYI